MNTNEIKREIETIDKMIQLKRLEIKELYRERHLLKSQQKQLKV